MTTTTRTKKTTARKPAKSIEEKKAHAEALHESITHQVEQLRDSERWTAFLDFAQAFHAYSINNLLLILSQREDASRVAGFRTWQGLNRQVRKGEKGIRIFRVLDQEGDRGKRKRRRGRKEDRAVPDPVGVRYRPDGTDGPRAGRPRYHHRPAHRRRRPRHRGRPQRLPHRGRLDRRAFQSPRHHERRDAPRDDDRRH
ncbi:ArdC family protein [Frondihabitans sp. 762G35]|uniref:ArdC family protein n=1 Tax=Frondihabitans sp. 762G35 TaxID=1446794 RepID=UPI003FA4487A